MSSARREVALDSHSGRALAEAMSPLLTDSEVSQQLAGLANWRRADGDDPAIAATYEFTDFVAALDFVNQVGHEAELMNHHPDVDIRWNKVTLVLSTHSEGGLTHHDFELAHRINEVAGQEA
jgi:4a-hydroxytetrahydrobiopterin dehydratase